MKAIFHIHTNHSFDSIQSAESIVNWCNKNGVDVVFITDHNTIAGALEAKKYAEKNSLPVNVIIGSELATDVGDIIGIFLSKNVKSKKYLQAIKEIKAQHGMVVIPHPYRSHDIRKVSSLKSVDFAEIWNGETSELKEKNVKVLQKNLKTKPIVGSDAHFAFELGNSMLYFKSIDDFKKGKIKFRLIKKSGVGIYLGWLVAKVKGVLKWRSIC